MKACMLHPENECRPDAENRCVCAPPGLSHRDTCATKRGERCDCMVLHVAEPSSLLAMMLAINGAGARRDQEERERKAVESVSGERSP